MGNDRTLLNSMIFSASSAIAADVLGSEHVIVIVVVILDPLHGSEYLQLDIGNGVFVFRLSTVLNRYVHETMAFVILF